jgi:alanine-synthesizing transaminase
MFSSRFRWDLETNRLSRLIGKKKNAGAPLLDLTESNPTRAGFSYPEDAILQPLEHTSALCYEPTPRGLPAARRAVARYYSERNCEIDPDRLHLTASTSEAYAWLFKLLCDDGDSVIAPQPSYPLLDFLAALEGVRLRHYALDYVHLRGWRIDFDSLRQALDERARAVIVVNPNNPTGSYLHPEDAAILSALCAERGIAVIADEVFGDYAWRGKKRCGVSLAGRAAALTFVLSGLSKVVALPQMKLGWIVTSGPEPVVCEAMERLDLIADTYLSVSAPIQTAAGIWLGMRAGIQSQIMARVQSNLDTLASAIEDTSCRLLESDGGWYATLEVPRNASEEELVLMLLDEEDVLVHPGYFFDFAREAFLVISLIAPEPVFCEAIDRLLRRVG